MRYKTITFNIAPEVSSLGVKGAYFTLGGINNRDIDPEFEKIKNETIENILTTLSENSILNNPIMEGFRRLHEAVGRSGKKNVSSPENLLNFLFNNRTLPHVNLLVDIYNLVSVKSGLALGAHDISNISGNIQLKFTTGTEKFLPLGYQKIKPVGAGEYAYIDDDNEIICRLEVRQVEKTKITLETQECFYIIQGNMNTSAEQIHLATNELIDLTTKFCGGDVHILLLPSN
jgi:DNA/RNA-binding domain of Phe-tRNA-synthetase-like protein